MTSISEGGIEIPIRTFRVFEAIAALEMGGYKLGRNHVMETNEADDTIIDVCASGIMALNLGVDLVAFFHALDNVILSNGLTLKYQIVQWVDQDGKSLDTIIKALKSKTRKVADQELSIPLRDYGHLTNYLGKRV
jgi:hypothetical protein